MTKYSPTGVTMEWSRTLTIQLIHDQDCDGYIYEHINPGTNQQRDCKWGQIIF